jgi:hypothetical protein
MSKPQLARKQVDLELALRLCKFPGMQPVASASGKYNAAILADRRLSVSAAGSKPLVRCVNLQPSALSFSHSLGCDVQNVWD